MIKKLKLEDIDPVGDLKNKLWKAFVFLRSEPIGLDEYQIVFYLLTLHNYGFLERVLTLHQQQKRDWLLDIVLQPEDVNTIPYENMRMVYEPILYSISDNTLDELTRLICSLKRDVLKENFIYVFEETLNHYIKSTKCYIENSTPSELTNFMSIIAETKENDTIYNPFAGLASFSLNQKNNVSYYGQEINLKTWALGGLNMIAHELSGNAILENGDSISNWNPVKRKYDLIISCPPFNVRLRQNIEGKFGEIRKIEQLILERGIQDLKVNGKLILLFPSSFASNGGIDEKYREFLLQNELIDQVISFPGGLLYNTSVSFLILVIDKNKKEKGSVLFADARKFINDTNAGKELNVYSLVSALASSHKHNQIQRISNTEIATSNYNFNPVRYLFKKNEGTTLKDLVTIVRGQRNNEGIIGKFIRTRDLKNDKISFNLELENVENAVLPKFTQKIQESCILISLRWKSLKPTYFLYYNFPIYISNDIIALRIDDERLDTAYFINELHSFNVQEQIESLRSGSSISSITKSDLLDLIIELPSLELQRAKIKGVLEAFADKKREELALFKKIYGLESGIIGQNSYLRHTISGPTSNLKSSLENISSIMVNQILPNFPELMNLKVNENYAYSLGDYLKFMERDCSKISHSVNHHLKVEKDIFSKKLVAIDLTSFLQKYITEYQEKTNLGFQIQLSYDDEYFLDTNGKLKHIYISGNEELLVDMLDNLIKNAVDHAFLGSNDNLIEIYLSEYLAYIEEKSNTVSHVSILLSNTGKSFPVNFTESDFSKNGYKSDLSRGDGFGGYYISEIIKKHNGWFDIIDERGPEGIGSDLATSFEIFFPIIEDFNNEEI